MACGWLLHGVGSIAVRLAIRLFLALTVVVSVSCDGGDDEAPPPIAQRLLTAEDAPGSKPNPDVERETTTDLEEFVSSFSQHFIDPDREEMTTVFQEAGFKAAGTDVRFLGETQTDTMPYLFSWFFELESEEGASSVLDWVEADSMKPCPHSCAFRVSSFEVDGIPGARGVHRIATAEDVKATGAEDPPSDNYWVGFTVGSSVYTMELRGPPGSVTAEQALRIARAYHDRLTP